MPYQSCWLDKIMSRICPYSVGSMSFENIAMVALLILYLMTSSTYMYVHTYHLHTCFMTLAPLFANLMLRSFLLLMTL